MNDLEYIKWICLSVAVFGAIIAAYEWNMPQPPEWVVKVRMWMNRRKR